MSKDLGRNARLWSVLLGAGLLYLAATALGWIHLSSVAPEPPPLPGAHPSYPPGAGFDAIGEREFEVTVESIADVRYSFELPADDPLLSDLSEGVFRQQQSWTISDVRISDDEGYVSVTWSPPVVTRLDNQPGSVSFVGETDQLSGTIEVTLRGEPASFRVASVGRSITGASPREVVETQTSSEVGGTLTEESREVRVWLQGPATNQPSEQAVIPAWVLASVNRLAFLIWPVVPWLLLRRQLGKDDWGPSSHRQGLYLLSALIVCSMALVVSDTWYRAVTQALVDRDLLLGELAHPAPAAAAVMAAWAAVGIRNVDARRRPLPLATAMVALACAIGIVLMVYFGYWSSGSALEPYRIAAGVGIGLLGGLSLSWGLGGVGLLPSTLPAAVLVLFAAANGTDNWLLDSIVTSAVAWVAITSLLCTVIWVVILSATPDEDSRRNRVGVRLLVVLTCAVAALPATINTRWWTLLDEWDATSLWYSISTISQLGLVLVGVGLLKSRPPAITRDVAAALATAMLLRPTAAFLGIAWAFLLGYWLVRWVLLPVGQTRTDLFAPPEGHGTKEKIEEVYRASQAARLTRDLGESLQRKVARGDLSTSDAAEISTQIRQALTTTPSPPTSYERLSALSWAGKPDPWLRAMWGAAAAGGLGVVLTLGTLADDITDITQLLNWRSWLTVATVIVNFRFPFYGLVFGFLLPVIPGTTGLAKALRLFAVLSVSETTVLLIPFDPAADTAQAVTLRIVQIAATCALLGVGADLLALRRIGVGLPGLRDLYHTNSLVLWSSGIAVTLATAMATAALGAAANLMVERILPPPPPAQLTDTQTPGQGQAGP